MLVGKTILAQKVSIVSHEEEPARTPMNLRISGVSPEATFPLSLTNLTKAGEITQLLGDGNLDVMVKQHKGRLLGLSLLTPRQGAADLVFGVARREGIVAVAVLVTDLAILTVDHHIRPLIAGDPPGYFESLFLGRDHFAGALASVTLDCPLAAVRHHVLVLRHVNPLQGPDAEL